METLVQVTFQGLPAEATLARVCREEAESLAHAAGRSLSCRVSLSPATHPHEGGPPRVRVSAVLPGSLLVVDHSPADGAESPAAAVRGAFASLRRRLADEARRIRADLQTHADPPCGRISGLDAVRGRGSLTTQDGRELDFPAHGVREASFEELELGMEVAFHEEQGDHGLRASVVRPLARRGRRRP